MAALSGPLSRRKLGTQSGAMTREARKLDNAGYGRAASTAMLAATQQKITEGGAITSAESNMSKQRLELEAKSGLMEARRRASLGTDSATTTPSANASAPSMNAADAQKSRMDFYAKRNGTPEPMLQRPPMGSVSGNPNAAVPTTNADGMVSVPPSSMTSAPGAAQRESRIDGMPASLAIARSQAIMAAGGPREEFGAAAANKNLGEEVTNDSLRSAMADYKRRSAADDPAARAARGAAYTAETSAPGNLAGLAARDAANMDDRPGFLTRVRAESRLEGSDSRDDIIGRLNTERAARGKAPIELTGKELNDADLAERDLRAGNVKGESDLLYSIAESEEGRNFPEIAKKTRSGVYDLEAARESGAELGRARIVELRRRNRDAR